MYEAILSIAAQILVRQAMSVELSKTILLKMLRLSIRFLRIVKLNSFSYGSKDIFCSKGLMCLIRILSSVGVLCFAVRFTVCWDNCILGTHNPCQIMEVPKETNGRKSQA